MHAEAVRYRWVALVLGAVLATGCASWAPRSDSRDIVGPRAAPDLQDALRDASPPQPSSSAASTEPKTQGPLRRRHSERRRGTDVALVLPEEVALSPERGSGWSRDDTNRVTASELMEMAPNERRSFMQQAAPGLPMPSNFESAELAEQFSDQFNHGMRDILKTLSMAAAMNLAILPLVPKVPRLAAESGTKVLSKEAQRGIHSLEKRIAEHQKKLADFKANPTVRPGMEGQTKEVIEAAQQSRIRHLEKEIQTFRENIEKLKEGK